MKSSFKILILISIIAVFVSYCSEDKNPLPSVSHPEGWNDVGAQNFHGTKVLDVGYNSCKSCHGIDLKGDKSGVSCYNSSCHTIYPHSPEWSLIGDANFHGVYLKAHENAIENCKQCHGANLKGGTSGISCYSCHPQGSSLPKK